MTFVELVRAVLLIIPFACFFCALLFVMGQGKKNFSQMAENGLGRLKRHGAAAVILVAVYAAAFFGVEMFRVSSQASIIIGFNYPEASNGLYPNKTKFNASEIIADEVLETAISNGNMVNVSTEDLKKCLKVTPLKAGNSLSQDQTYISTEYELSYTASWDTRHLEPGVVVDMISHAYYEIFVDRYSRKTNILSLDEGDLEDIEYLDIASVYDAKMEELQDYATLLSYENASFRSETTGETFSSIAKKAQNFRSVQLERYEAYVLSHGLVKDQEQYIAKLNYDNKITSLDYLKIVAAHEVNLETIELYERDMATIVLVPTEDVDGKYYMSRTKIGVDYFADEAEKSMQYAADNQLDIETNNYAISQFQSITPTAAEEQNANAMLEALQEEYVSLSESLMQTIADYDKKTTNDYITIISNYVNHVSGQQAKKIAAVSAFFAAMLCLFIVVLPQSGNTVLFERASAQKHSRRRAVKKGQGKGPKAVVGKTAQTALAEKLPEEQKTEEDGWKSAGDSGNDNKEGM